jgi:hypothetical protein
MPLAIQNCISPPAARKFVSLHSPSTDPSPNHGRTLVLVYHANGQRISDAVPEGNLLQERSRQRLSPGIPQAWYSTRRTKTARDSASTKSTWVRASVSSTREPMKPESRPSSEQGFASVLNLPLITGSPRHPWLSTPLLANLL